MPPAAVEEKTEEKKPVAAEKPLREKEPEEEKRMPPPRTAPADDVAPSAPLGVAAAPSVRRLARELGISNLVIRFGNGSPREDT